MSTKVLSIETATMLGGIAITDSEAGLIAERRLNVKATHSERLMPELEDTLLSTGLKVSDLDAVAVSIGPGAFTGLRIGLGAAKGLAMSAGLRLVPVPTLEAMAFCLPHLSADVCVMLDARRGEVYAGLYDTSRGRPQEKLAARAIKAVDFVSLIKDTREVIFMGQGAKVYQSDIKDALGKEVILAPSHLMVPSPASVAALGLMILEGPDELPDPISLVPMYLRKSEAELNRK